MVEAPYKLPVRATPAGDIDDAEGRWILTTKGHRNWARANCAQYAVKILNHHQALVEALRNLLSEAGKELAHAPDGDGDCPVCKALATARALLAELEQPNV